MSPFMKERAGATYQDEILRNVSGGEIAENSVVDGTTIALNGDGRRMLLTGTIMIWTGAPGSSKVTPINPAGGVGGVDEADIAGIVMHTTEFWPGTTEANKDDASIALFTKNCHFYAAKLIGYTNNAAIVKLAMQGGGNGRCANCSFG